MRTFSLITVAYGTISIMKEIYQLHRKRLAYFKEIVSLINWTLYISLILFVVPFLLTTTENEFKSISKYTRSFAPVGLLLSWFTLLLKLQRFDKVGIYVVMFLEILQTLIKVLLIFSILILAFGLTFFMLLSEVFFFNFEVSTLTPTEGGKKKHLPHL